MKLTKCSRGHYYDMDKFGVCPECGSADDVRTTPLEECGPTRPEEDKDDNKTIKKWKRKDAVVEPVVGWLICVEGPHMGADFRLTAGGNFIGRDSEMDVCLKNDETVSRHKHLNVTYEPKSGTFLVAPGDTKELSYLNDNVVLETKKLNAYDTLLVGECKLLFVPFCSDSFNWDNKKAE